MSNSSASLLIGSVIALSLLLSTVVCPSFAHGGGGGGHFSGGGGHFSGGGAHFSGGGAHFSGGGTHFSSGMSSAHFSSFSPHSFSSPHMSSFGGGGAHFFSGNHSAASASYVNSAPPMHFDSIFGRHHSNAAESINRHAPFNDNADFARQHSSVNVDAMPQTTGDAGMATHHHFWSFGHHSDAVSASPISSDVVSQHHHFWSSHHDRSMGLGLYGDGQGIKAEAQPFTIEDVPLHEHQPELAHSVTQVPYGSHHWLKQQYANGLMTPPVMPHMPVTPVAITHTAPVFYIPQAPNYYCGPSYNRNYGSAYGFGNLWSPNYSYYGTGYSAYNYGYGYGYGTSSLASILLRSLSLLGLGGYSYASSSGLAGNGYNYDPNAYAALNSAIGGGYNYDPNAYANAGLGTGGILDPNSTAGSGNSNDPNAFPNNSGIANLPPFAAYGNNSFMNNPAAPYIDPNNLPPDPLPIAQPAAQPDQIGLSATAESLPTQSDRPAFNPVGFPYHNKGLLGVAFAHMIGLPSGSYRTPSLLAVVFSHQFWEEQNKRMADQEAIPDIPESVATHANP